MMGNFYETVVKAINEERVIWIATAQCIQIEYMRKREYLYNVLGIFVHYGLEVRSAGENRCRIDWIRFLPVPKAAIEGKTGPARFSRTRSAVKPSARDGYTQRSFRSAGPEESALICETEELLRPVRAKLKALGKMGIAASNCEQVLRSACRDNLKS
jgi:hypothetical protein